MLLRDSFGRSVISIHALLAESDFSPISRGFSGGYFYPRSPCGERLGAIGQLQCIHGDFYPRSPCGERPFTSITITCTASFLSTLSLRRATRVRQRDKLQDGHFYPRSPCGERHSLTDDVSTGGKFLSTLSLRRATQRT